MERVDRTEAWRRAAEIDPPLIIDSEDSAAPALIRSLLFERWPDLLPEDLALDEVTRFYNHYYWFVRFVSEYQAAHGSDAGLEQQAIELLSQAPDGVDWDGLQSLDALARELGPSGVA
jgi:hypothetical protein